MVTSKTPNRRKSRGQGMTEYIIVVALIAIGTIGIITLFGDNIRKLFGASSDALAGQQTVNPNTTLKSAANIQDDKNLKTFSEKQY